MEKELIKWFIFVWGITILITTIWNGLNRIVNPSPSKQLTDKKYSIVHIMTGLSGLPCIITAVLFLVRPSIYNSLLPIYLEEKFKLFLMVIAILFGLIGLVLISSGIIAMGNRWTFFAKVNKEEDIINNGPYRYIRHPIYLGTCLGHIAFAIILPSIWITIMVLIRLITCYWRAVWEEKFLVEIYGDRYQLYRSNRGMIIPRGLFY